MQTSYSTSQIILHWISAVIILWATLSGFWISLFDLDPDLKNWVSFFNVSLTTLFIPVFAVRIYLACRQPTHPEAPARTLDTLMAAWAHRLLYGLTTVVLLTGVMMMDRPINIFDWVLIPQPLTDHGLIDLFFKIHVVACWVLALLIGLHVAAVIKHEASGNPILKRMSLSRANGQGAGARPDAAKEDDAPPT